MTVANEWRSRHRKSTFRTLDEVTSFQRDIVPVGCPIPKQKTHHMIVTWDNEEGLPTNFERLNLGKHERCCFIFLPFFFTLSFLRWCYLLLTRFLLGLCLGTYRRKVKQTSGQPSSFIYCLPVFDTPNEYAYSSETSPRSQITFCSSPTHSELSLSHTAWGTIAVPGESTQNETPWSPSVSHGVVLLK